MHRIENYFRDFNWRKLFFTKFGYKQWQDEQIFYPRLLPLYKKTKYFLFGGTGSTIIYMSDGKYSGGGLADKLKGIITLYKYAKSHSINFKINWTHPFNLLDYLEPNNYDWILADGDVVYDQRVSYPFCLQYHAKPEEEQLQCNYHQKKLDRFFAKKQNLNQYHIYTNATLFSKQEYHILFHELFKPVHRIEAALDDCISELHGDEFVAVHFRFIELLGDFNDEWSDCTLPDFEKERYINDGISEIEKVFIENKHMKVLVSSDSKTFLERCRSLPYVYIIPGEISHTNIKGAITYDKEFLDLLMLSKAKKIYVFHRDKMWRSGFPLAASMIGNVPLVQIEY